MKKYIAIILILVILLLPGCTADPEPTAPSIELPQISTNLIDRPEISRPVEQTLPATEVPTTAAPPETTTPAPSAPATTAAPVYNNINRGIVIDNAYICGYLGLSYVLPEGQSFCTDAELAETQGFDAETITDEDMARILGETSYFIDMQTWGLSQGAPFVNLSYHDLNAFGPVTDAADYFEKSKEASLRLFESYGFQDVSFEVEDYELDGVKCASAVIRCSVGGTETYQRMVGILMDHYVAMLTATGSDESADALLQGFHWLQY